MGADGPAEGEGRGRGDGGNLPAERKTIEAKGRCRCQAARERERERRATAATILSSGSSYLTEELTLPPGTASFLFLFPRQRSPRTLPPTLLPRHSTPPHALFLPLPESPPPTPPPPYVGFKYIFRRLCLSVTCFHSAQSQAKDSPDTSEPRPSLLGPC